MMWPQHMPAQEKSLTVPDNSQYILTPPAPATPRINSARVFGVRPKAEFRYTIAATGDRPMTFSAEGLPKGLKLDAQTGIITGRLKKKGTYKVLLRAKNNLGETERDLRIEVGEDILLTPPMGWNSWNCWGKSVSQEKVLSSARAMVEKGLANYGYTYINIDDGWQGIRGGEHNAIQPNKKFPDIKGLVDQIHGMGLKVGIYSAPWVATYLGHIGTQCDNPEGKYEWIEKGVCDENYKIEDPEGKLHSGYFRYHGAYSFAEADARQWAEWGFDYLKYDWNPNDYYYTKEMSEALRATGRDIALSISGSDPFAMAYTWPELVQCWRTTDDIFDTWASIMRIGFGPQDRWPAFSGPGHWADADMLVVGMVGWGPNLHYTRLTPDEQYTHISLWALFSSPFLIGCDIAQMDDFTLSLLCNYEVNDICQDPRGMRAVPYFRGDGYVVYVKILENGNLAVGLFNTSTKPQKIGFTPRTLGLWSDKIFIRDVWRQIDVAEIGPRDRYEQEVDPHGAALLLVSPPNTLEKIVHKPYTIKR